LLIVAFSKLSIASTKALPSNVSIELNGISRGSTTNIMIEFHSLIQSGIVEIDICDIVNQAADTIKEITSSLFSVKVFYASMIQLSLLESGMILLF
jgi:hypothetical protein